MNEHELYSKALDLRAEMEKAEFAYREKERDYKRAANEHGFAVAEREYGILPGDMVTYTSREGYSEPAKKVTRRIRAERILFDTRYGRLSIFGRIVTAKGELGNQSDATFYIGDTESRQQFVKREPLK